MKKFLNEREHNFSKEEDEWNGFSKIIAKTRQEVFWWRRNFYKERNELAKFLLRQDKIYGGDNPYKDLIKFSTKINLFHAISKQH